MQPIDHGARFETVTRDGVRLRGMSWRPANDPVAVVVLAHGKDEHIGRYGHVVERLVEAGFAVYGQDHRGHGRSEGPRGVIRRFDDFVDDLDLLVDRAQAERPEWPLFLLGHSMGGLIAARYALRSQECLSGLILSGPALLIGAGLPAWAVRLLLGVSRIAPRLPLPRGKPGVLSRNPEIERAFASDALCHNGRTRLGFVRSLYLACEETRPRGAELTVPLLVMHGDTDTLTSCRGSQEFVERAASNEKTLKLWPENRHEIFNDLDSDAVIAYMLAWLTARMRSAASPVEGVGKDH